MNDQGKATVRFAVLVCAVAFVSGCLFSLAVQYLAHFFK